MKAMITLNRRSIIFIVVGLLVLTAVVYGFWPDSISVQTATVERDSLEVVVQEEGQTEVEDRYVVSAPVAAIARRMVVEAGDAVEAGDPVVDLEAPHASILDRRAQSEAEARVEGAEAAVEQAERQVDAAEAVSERAQEERRRVERLHEQGSATRREMEQATAEALQARARLESARAAVVSARADLRSVEAMLGGGDAEGTVASTLRAPVSGHVLAVHRPSEGPVAPGEALVEVADTEQLRVRIDVLSQDALRIESGTRVRLDQWGGDTTLQATVERVEPEGRTDVSALGVEEQRVGIIAQLDSPPADWERLSAGYRVVAEFVVWEGADVLQVPTGALFRTENGWAVFVVEGGRAERRLVNVGQQANLRAEIVSGLEENETVIVHPGNDVEDGVRVRPRG